MNDFLEKLLRIRSGFFRRMQLLFILDLIAIFSIFYSAFKVLNVEYFLSKYALNIPVYIIPPALAFIIAITLALLLHKKDRKINVPLLIERKYPELKEKLRTACDNRNEENVIVDSLKSQVSDALNNVSSSQVIARGKVLAKLLITILFIAGTVTISQNPDKYRIPPETITNFTNAVTGNTGEETNMTIDVGSRPEDQTGADKNGSGNIRGNPKIASLEGKDVDLTIFEGVGPGYNVKEVSQEQNPFTRSPPFPADALGSNVSDGGYSTLMKKTADEKKLIEDYAVKRS
ncbi:MAG: hypothetical protein OIN66_00245 [Candidatus Methanoperedens sp.]|nr:hypothetical protein [Candidatus Methanoperedens sp.]